MSTFQQYTTEEQSKELQALGAAQEDPRRSPIFQLYHVQIGGENLCVIPGHERDTDAPGMTFIRAFTFQEMFYELAAHYEISYASGMDNGVRLTLYYGTTFEEFHVEGAKPFDPFPAVYAAFVWHLKQHSSNPQS